MGAIIMSGTLIVIGIVAFILDNTKKGRKLFE